MANLEKTIQEALVNLPQKYRKVLDKFNLTDAVESIANKNNLNQKQERVLDEEITLITLGLHSSVEFMEQIEKRLNIQENQTTKIAKDVTNQVLKPIKKLASEDLEQIQEPPVPEPPTKNGEMPESSGYGGASDPYREPVDEQ